MPPSPQTIDRLSFGIGNTGWWVVGLAMAVVLLPPLMLTLALLTLAGQVALVGIGMCGLGRSIRPKEVIGQPMRQPAVFVSVHVPACREPAPVVIATLISLMNQQDAVPHEIIVMINNTPDPKDWQPVAQWCAKTGGPFRLLRIDRVTGAKAGALNIALAHSDSRTTHIVTVDADYQVDADFLHNLGAEISGGNTTFFQYPQAYRNVSPASMGIAREMEDYFQRQALAANLGQAMLLTGTLSVIPKAALLAVGGWPTASCTEDAELGTRLISAGYKGVYVDQVVGRGLMPLDLTGLHKQRHRWAAGNARVLALWLPQILRSRPSPRSHWMFRQLLVVSQLTAWLNMGCLAVLTLCAALAHMALGVEGGRATVQMTIWLSCSTILTIVASALPLLSNRHHPRDTLQICLTAFLSRIAILPVAAWATLIGALPKPQRFHVTPKVLQRGLSRLLTPPVLIASILAALVIPSALAMGQMVALLTGLTLLLPAFASFATGRALQTYARTTGVQRMPC